MRQGVTEPVLFGCVPTGRLLAWPGRLEKPRLAVLVPQALTLTANVSFTVQAGAARSRGTISVNEFPETVSAGAGATQPAGETLTPGAGAVRAKAGGRISLR